MLLHEIAKVLLERRQSPLYHFMDNAKTKAVFSSDTMEARWGHSIQVYDDRKKKMTTVLNPKQTNRSFGIRNLEKEEELRKKDSWAPPASPRMWGNSFTRNPKLTMPVYAVQLVVDEGKLNQTNKIIPVNGQLLYHRHSTGHGLDKERELSEEFVLGDIKNLHRVIVKIFLLDSAENEIHELTNRYAAAWHIPVELRPTKGTS